MIFWLNRGGVTTKTKTHHFSVGHLENSPHSDTRFWISYDIRGKMVLVNLPGGFSSLNVCVARTICRPTVVLRPLLSRHPL